MAQISKTIRRKPIIAPEIVVESLEKKIINKGTGAGGSNTNLYGKKFEEKTNNERRLLEQGYIKHSFTKNSSKKHNYYLTKEFDDKKITFVLQSGLKTFMKNMYNIELFRCPDEAYIIEYKSVTTTTDVTTATNVTTATIVDSANEEGAVDKDTSPKKDLEKSITTVNTIDTNPYKLGRKVIKILEKKEQNVEGSVETKLWSGPSLKREYELVLGSQFEVLYGFCVSDFLKNKFTSKDKKYTVLQTILNEANINVLYGDDDNYFETFDTWFNASL